MTRVTKIALFTTIIATIFTLSGCGSSSDTSTTDSTSSTTIETNTTSASTTTQSDADFAATDWTEETHSKNVDPNYDEVFDDAQVKRLDFVVTKERWQSMLDDMTNTYGTLGQGSQGNTGLIDTDEDPIFVPADVYYEGTQWYRVGIRFKGNSSLQSAWKNGILKLSFKLDFDEYEDDYPQIDNQRFYGFKKFSLKNNYDDQSFLREKVAADVFKDAGLAVSHTAFYTLYVDYGEGPEYFGLYTLVEEVDGEVLDTQFSSDEGNLYKPEDGSANFVEGTFNTEDFTKKTNEDEEDWSDIESLFAALHDDSRVSDAASWRIDIESVFNVDQYLKYLAVNGIIQNWDTYGRMAHNYYLYNNPDNGLLTWVPWDNNEALQDGKLGGALNLDFSNLNDADWPLIAKLYADDTYKAQYDAYVQEVIDGAFETSTMQDKYDTYADLIEPYATSERSGYSFLSSSRDFLDAVSELKAHASERATAVENYLK
ncbi:MAG: Spore coat protein [uncultured Sulfurovum sp.]|uniref:Spore coat protein n=1 Tax=uncultured Sulfurovum sp. TaxID=269237 RepID=A0A6S6S5D3_9BACT|nr:MAG: Spore coat protein [uncultured Sulfurovum sp.]